MNAEPAPLLAIRELTLAIALHDAVARILNGVNLIVHRGERVALVGESACGKSLTARAVMGLYCSSGSNQKSMPLASWYPLNGVAAKIGAGPQRGKQFRHR